MRDTGGDSRSGADRCAPAHTRPRPRWIGVQAYRRPRAPDPVAGRRTQPMTWDLSWCPALPAAGPERALVCWLSPSAEQSVHGPAGR